LASRTDREPNVPGGPDVGQMVAQLEARLAESPGDLEGWLLLGRSLGVLGDAQGSLDAYRRAQALAGDDPRVLGALGESLVVASGGMVTPEAQDLFRRLAGRSVEDPRPAFYLGLADSQAGDYQKALERWQALLADAPADAPWRERVAEAVRGAAVELKLDPEAVLARIPSAPAPAALPQPSEEDVARAAAMSPEQQQAFIRSMVDRLQARMDADGSDVEGWLRLAQARIALGEPDRARTAFEQALRLHPDEPVLLKSYAALLLGPIRPETGLPEIGDKPAELYGKAARLQPADPEPWYYLGIRALQEGRKDEARSSWEKVLAYLDPTHPEYAAIKERLGQLGG
jgi:cytochrome c-type biogenesis protein CcmH